MSTNHRAFRCLLLATCFFLGTSATKSAHNADNDDDYIPYIDSGLKDDFDWLLLKHLNTPAFSNVIVSPISLKIALALLYEGSGGNTEAELRTLLRFDANKTVVNAEFGRVLSALQENPKLGCDGNVAGPSRREYSLNLGTRIFMDYRIQPTTTFQSKACEVYRTKIEASNFTNSEKTSADINAWVSRLTSGKIAKLVDAKDVEESVMVVLNAIHFKGLWNLQFPKNQSHRGGFYLGPNQVAQVDYMATSGNYFFIESKELDAKLIRIPYQGKKYAMIIGLPNSKAGLASLIQRLNVSTLKNVLNIMDKQTVDLILPKFKFDFGIHLADTLKNMGVKSLFENTVSLPGISRGNNEIKPQVSEIIQKSGIEVNEDGSEAYAATIIQLTNKFGEAQSEFNATHPFMFYIEDQTTHTILFIGKVENPLESSVPVPSRFGQVQSAQPIGEEVSLTPLNTDSEQSISKRFNYFDLELLREISNEENVFISPASIKATLGMILEGAQGECAAEITKTLRLPINLSESRNQLKPLLFDLSDNSAHSILQSSNGIFVNEKLALQPNYLKVINEFYRGTVGQINFDNAQRASNAINGWVTESTKGLIRNIVTPENLSPDTSILITNAMYFRGIWKFAFDPSLTSVRCFDLTSGQCQQSYMMQNSVETNYRFVPEIDAHALELPYNDDKYAMLILLPQVKNNIHSLIRDLQHESFSSIVDKLEPTEVLVEIPKFRVEFSTSLVEPLQQLKIREIFGENANLTGIVKNQKVNIGNILHRTHIDVNESGTVAAAATSAIVIPLMGTSAARVICNHPFMFFIYKRANKNILFEGIVNKPIAAPPGTNLRFNGLYKGANYQANLSAPY